MSITDSTTVLTTSTTSTISPYVREIYKASSEEENDDGEELQQHNRNHHSKFKKKHTRKHHKKHHAQPSSSYHLPGVNEYYSHSFSPAYHHFSSRLGINNGGGRGSTAHHQHHHRNMNKHRNGNNKHKVSQTYGTEQRQVKDDGQYRSGFRANYGSEQYRGRISFYDNSNKLETQDDIHRKLNGRTKEKYPYFNKVKTHLEEEDEDLPPYIKKYNRRNKQLIDLLEGTLPPQSQSENLRRFHSHVKKNPHWLEDDLFEEQKPSKNKWSTEIEATPHPNALPDESVHVIYDEDTDKTTLLANMNSKNNKSLPNKPTFNLTASSIASNNHSPPFKLSSRAGQFVYHTVTQSPLIGGAGGGGAGGYGGVKKKRLPFVAITDRKVGGPPRMRRRTSMSSINTSNSEQNRLTMP